MTIYMHQGTDAFDPAVLEHNVSEYWDKWKDSSKMACALWASPFNDNKDNSWERFWYSDYGNVEKKALEEASFDKGMHTVFIEQNFYDIDDMESFYTQPLEPMTKRLVDFAKNNDMGITVTKDDIKQWVAEAPSIIEKAKGIAKTKCQEFRDNSFYFTVDDSKILHIHTRVDIEPYVKDVTPPDISFKIFAIDYDKIKESGYDGIELHNASTLRNDSLFYTWDVDSIAVWNPDCIRVIDREIAALSRLACGQLSNIDMIDTTFNVNYLFGWVERNMEAVQQAIDDKIISIEQLANVFSQHSESSGRTNDANEEIQQEQEKQEIEEPEITPFLNR